MLIKVTDELWLESRNVKSLWLYETTGTDGRYQVYADHKMLGGFDTETAAQSFAEAVVDKLNNATRKEIQIPQFVEANTYDCG